jgi:hypothetical protein
MLLGFVWKGFGFLFTSDRIEQNFACFLIFANVSADRVKLIWGKIWSSHGGDSSSSGLWRRVVMWWGTKMRDSLDLWNVCILPHHYTASQPRRTRIDMVWINKRKYVIFLCCFVYFTFNSSLLITLILSRFHLFNFWPFCHLSLLFCYIFVYSLIFPLFVEFSPPSFIAFFYMFLYLYIILPTYFSSVSFFSHFSNFFLCFYFFISFCLYLIFFLIFSSFVFIPSSSAYLCIFISLNNCGILRKAHVSLSIL